MKRRHFIKSLPYSTALPFMKTAADTIIYNENMITVNPKQQRAEATTIEQTMVGGEWVF